MQLFKVKIKNKKIIFSDNDIAHIVKSLRKKKDDLIKCIDEDNNLYDTKIISIKPFSVEIINFQKVEDNSYNIHFYVGIVKKNNFELIVEKLNELNVREITPVYFQRSQSNIFLNYDRLNRIIDESCKQSNRIIPLKINNAIDFIELKNIISKNKNFIIADFKENNNSNTIDYGQQIKAIIGPEGGFTNEEISFLHNNCYSTILTNTILKTETAAIYLSTKIIEGIKYNER